MAIERTYKSVVKNILIYRRSADFEGCECDGSEGGGEEPETYDDLRFAPACEVEMMVDGGTSKEAFSAGISEIADLDDDAD